MPSCRLASELRSHIPKCFRSLHTLLGLSFCVYITLTTASSSPFTLLSLSVALACNNKSTVISALRSSSVNCWCPNFQKYSILFSCTSFVSSSSVCTFCTVSPVLLPIFFPVLSGAPFDIQLCKLFTRSFLLAMYQSTRHQVLRSCYPRLFFLRTLL